MLDLFIVKKMLSALSTPIKEAAERENIHFVSVYVVAFFTVSVLF